jgi:monoamine oxidase
MNSEWAESYVSLSDVAIKDQLLSELNEFFQGQATLLYLDHKIMNWSKEPFIGGVFSNHDYSGTYNQISSIARPIANNRIYFAGEALEPDGWYGLVQGAASTGQSVARKITNKFK